MKLRVPSSLALFAIILSCSGGSGIAQKPLDPEKVKKELARGESTFIKFVSNKDGSAQLLTSIATYKDQSGRVVELISAVHIADKKYYQKLDKRFGGYDSLLYEMIKPKGAKPNIGRTKKAKRSGISWLQVKMKDVLDLDFQLDGIDYSASNFVHADMTVRQFRKMSKDRNENILGVLLGAMNKKSKGDKKGPKQDKDKPIHMGHILAALMSKDSSRALKLLMARQLQYAEKMMAGGGGEDDKGSVILTERNKVCLEVMKKRLAKGDKNIGVFYGGAHMVDMERRMRKEFGFVKQKEEWVVAWNIPAPAPKKAKPTSKPAKR